MRTLIFSVVWAFALPALAALGAEVHEYKVGITGMT